MRPRSLFLLCRALALAALVTADDEDLLAHMNEVEMEHFFGTSDAGKIDVAYEVVSIREEESDRACLAMRDSMPN